YILFFFFFQAEDGIRDLIVTGVQTCALPISYPGAGLAPHSRLDHTASVRVSRRERNPPARGLHTVWLEPRFMLFLYPEFAKGSRSEERRVGKECRLWWWADE